jgi:glycosyltransferase involved in cell wall biosynthesis
MTSSPTVTWLLPVKNGMPFLTETLASIEAQTFRDFTVIAWDNGSTDGSVAELERWIPGRLKGAIVTDRPLGIGASLAEMVKMARTEFCARIDSDDVNLPTRLEQQMAFMEQHPEVAVVGTQVTKITGTGGDHGYNVRLPLSHEDIMHRMLYAWVMYHPTVLFRREAVLEAGNYRDIQPVEDYDLWMRVAVQRKLANLDLSLVKKRMLDSNVTRSAAREGQLESATLNCFATNAPGLFGCSTEDALKLRSKQSLFLLPALWRTIHSLCRKQGGTVAQRFKTPSLQEAVAHLIRRRDFVTRLWVASFRR